MTTNDALLGWFILWSLGALILGLGAAIAFRWQEVAGNDPGEVWMAVFMGVACWPLALIVCAIGGFGYLLFRVVPVAVVAEVVRRREKRVQAETEAKRVADEARHGVERGAHR